MARVRKEPVPLISLARRRTYYGLRPGRFGVPPSGRSLIRVTEDSIKFAPLLTPADVREIAERLDVRPTKVLGQNFVHDANTVRRIVRAAQLRPDDVVLEVGPGLGSLTLALLDTGSPVIAVEIDAVLASALPDTVARMRPERVASLAVLNRDALDLVPADIVDGAAHLPLPTALVANLPYNVAVPVLLTALQRFSSLQRVLVMVQAEVADRLAAEPGSKIYGAPSVKAAWYGRVERAGAIGRHVFWPAPNVESGLVRITRAAPPTGGELGKELAAGAPARATEVFAVVDAAFAQRRKMLRAALAANFGGGERVERALRRADIDPTVRGERVDVDGFVRIALALRGESTEKVE